MSDVAEQPPEPNPPREPDEDSLRLAEALVFASAEPVTARGLQRILADDLDADAVLAALKARYAGRGVELIEVGGRECLFFKPFHVDIALLRGTTAAKRIPIRFRDKGVVGFDIAGDEFGHPPKRHLEAFKYILSKNFNITIHAGEAFGLP